jgi:hypothetical protein
MERGLACPLSPNEEITLRRVQAATRLADLDGRHLDRLAALKLVVVGRRAVALTALGKRRIEDTLPPDRAAAQKRREALLFGCLLGLDPPRPSGHPSQSAPMDKS